MNTQEVLATIPGEGNIRKATPAFWEIRNAYKKTLNRMGFSLYKDGQDQWVVDISNVDASQDSMQETLNKIRRENAFYRQGVWQDTNEKFSR